MNSPDKVFKNKIRTGDSTLPKVVGSIGKGAAIKGIYPTLAG